MKSVTDDEENYEDYQRGQGEVNGDGLQDLFRSFKTQEAQQRSDKQQQSCQDWERKGEVTQINQ